MYLTNTNKTVLALTNTAQCIMTFASLFCLKRDIPFVAVHLTTMGVACVNLIVILSIVLSATHIEHSNVKEGFIDTFFRPALFLSVFFMTVAVVGVTFILVVYHP